MLLSSGGVAVDLEIRRRGRVVVHLWLGAWVGWGCAALGRSATPRSLPIHTLASSP